MTEQNYVCPAGSPLSVGNTLLNAPVVIGCTLPSIREVFVALPKDGDFLSHFLFPLPPPY